MKYPVILKYTFVYICSGNYYKPVTSTYYQLFTNLSESRMVSISNSVYEKVDLKKYSDNEIEFSYGFYKYSHPDTFVADTELIEYFYKLNYGEKVSINCVYKYWAYAKGAENGPANLTVEWISYEDFLNEIIEESKESKYKAIDVANALIKEKMYDIAFNMLLGTKEYSYELGLCYEKGYGTEVDLDKALKNYLYTFGYDRDRGIERILKARGKTIKLDDVKETILYLSMEDYFSAYGKAVIPTEIADNTLEDMRTNVEINVIYFLELGRPFNDPFYHPTDNMCKLAMYYDLINDVKEDNKNKYHTVKWEDDPYDGGEFRYDIYHDDLIVETLQKEAKKNDVIALGCLLVQFGIHPNNENFSSYLLDNIDEIIQRLLEVAKHGNKKDSGMAYYFLGLYYQRVAEKAQDNYGYKYYIEGKKYTYEGNDIEQDLNNYIIKNNIKQSDSILTMISNLNDHYNFLTKDGNYNEEIKNLESFIIYLFNKNYDKYHGIKKENMEQADKYFELSVEKGFHLAIAHIAKKIVEENTKEDALKILEVHKRYIPNIRYTYSEKYYKLLAELKENK